MKIKKNYEGGIIKKTYQQKIELPWCVHIEFGKKHFVRNRHCTCPSGWRNRDKCSSPNDDHTNPCYFRFLFYLTHKQLYKTELK